MELGRFHQLLGLLLAAAMASVSVSVCAADESQATPRNGRKVLKAAKGAVLRGVLAEIQHKQAADRGAASRAAADNGHKVDERSSEAADREATLLCIVSALDQVMLLSGTQRDELLVLFSSRWQGQWRTARTWHALINPVRTPWQTTMIHAAFGVLEIPEPELAPILRPAQLAACRELRVFALALGHRDTTEPRAVELLFELSIDDVAAACDLTDEQRTRLTLTGKSDISRSRELMDWTTRFRRANHKYAAAPAVMDPSFPAGTLPDDLSRYRKALDQWLTAEQRQRLAHAHQRRRQFERRAELAAILRVIRCYGHPNEAQCERLSERIVEQLDRAPPGNDDVSMRAQLLAALSRLGSDDVADLVGGDRRNFALLWEELRAGLQKMHLAKALTSSR